MTSTEGAALADHRPGRSTRRSPTTADAADAVQRRQVPTTPSADDDGSPVELGTAFTPAKDGRSRRSGSTRAPATAAPTRARCGARPASGWPTVTFTGETATGLADGDARDARAGDGRARTYVVSYHAPQGHYSSTAGFFTDAAGPSGDLTAPAATTAATSTAPAVASRPTSWAPTNYFVDVVFAATPPTLDRHRRAPRRRGDRRARARRSRRRRFTRADRPPGWSMTVKQGGTRSPARPRCRPTRKTLTFTPDGARCRPTPTSR